MKFNTPYTKHNDPITIEFGPSLTDQQYKQSCDINFIVNQYVKMGVPIPQSQVSYADLTTLEDYDKALLTVSEYKSAFECLPAKERERFHGDVREYLDFVSNPLNLKESYEKNYIDPNSVSQELVYPERYVKPSTDELNPVKPVSDVSSGTSEQTKE